MFPGILEKAKWFYGRDLAEAPIIKFSNGLETVLLILQVDEGTFNVVTRVNEIHATNFLRMIKEKT